LALERVVTGLVTWLQCGDALRSEVSGMVEIKSNSLFLREGGLISFIQGLQ